VRSQRLRPVRARRIRTSIQTVSASTTGGHTQLSRVIVACSGVKARRANPVAARVAAGTAAQRCGWFVWRSVRTAMSAHPSPKPTRIEPVMTLSVPPAKTTRVSTRAVIAPAARDPATMRAMGPVGGVAGAATSARCSVWWWSTLMSGLALAVGGGGALLISVVPIGFVRTGQMAGIRESGRLEAA
jgi:hypothetical protein